MKQRMKRQGASLLLPLWLGAVAFTAVTALTACVVYEPVPAPQAPFERSWSAINGAMVDQGVTIIEQDHARGLVRGTRGSVGVVSTVGVQADGRVRVEINTTGAIGGDSTLADRIRNSYDRRMGR